MEKGVVNRKNFSVKEKEQILIKTNHKCARCGKKLTTDTMTIEHMFPVAKGGDNGEYNIIALCERCNEEKSNRVFNLDDFYKYIDDKYRDKYDETLTKFMYRAVNRNKSIMPEDVRIYKLLNSAYLQMYFNTFRRCKKNKKKVSEIIDKTSISIKMELAYEAESEEIYDFLVKTYKRKHKSDKMYDNIYKIRELVNYGQVYTFRMPDNTIKGVLGLFNVARHNIEMPMQIENLAEVQEKDIIHIITLFELDDIYENASRLVFLDVMKDFKLSNLMLIAFSETQRQHELLKGTTKIFNIPCRFRGYDGYMQTYTPAGEREAIEYYLECTECKENSENEENDMEDKDDI